MISIGYVAKYFHRYALFVYNSSFSEVTAAAAAAATVPAPALYGEDLWRIYAYLAHMLSRSRLVDERVIRAVRRAYVRERRTWRTKTERGRDSRE